MRNLTRCIFISVLSLTAFTLFLYPAFFSISSLVSDPGLRTGAPTKLAFTLHQSLSKRLPEYIDERIDSNIATTLTTDQIEATEWPLYGAFFYLRSTESLQKQWEADTSLTSLAPAASGKEAIEASARLLLDENHAHWVKLYWGENYQSTPNNFYRLLVAGGLGAHHRLTGSEDYLPVLRSNLEGIIHHLDESHHALIDDYPGQCFPMDVVASIGIVLENEDLLGKDQTNWAKDTLARLLKNTNGQLPAYTASVRTGATQVSTRACTNGFGLPFISLIDPETGAKLYTEYSEQFWKEGWIASGWREFDQSQQHDWFYFDADAGPVLWSFGTSATGLGLGVARSYGDQQKSSILAYELLATAIPLPNGRLLVPSLVANKTHAPYFPEIVLMHQLSQTATDPKDSGPIPAIFWIITIIQLALGILFMRPAYKQLQQWRKPVTPVS